MKPFLFRTRAVVSSSFQPRALQDTQITLYVRTPGRPSIGRGYGRLLIMSSSPELNLSGRDVYQHTFFSGCSFATKEDFLSLVVIPSDIPSWSAEFRPWCLNAYVPVSKKTINTKSTTEGSTAQILNYKYQYNLYSCRKTQVSGNLSFLREP